MVFLVYTALIIIVIKLYLGCQLLDFPLVLDMGRAFFDVLDVCAVSLLSAISIRECLNRGPCNVFSSLVWLMLSYKLILAIRCGVATCAGRYIIKEIYIIDGLGVNNFLVSGCFKKNRLCSYIVMFF